MTTNTPTSLPGSTPPANPDITEILTDEDVQKLREGFHRAVLLGAAPRMVRYRKAAGFVQWIANTVFGSGTGEASTSLTPAQREMVILSVVATQRDVFLMSGRIYWALMEGLSVENIADVLMTVGTYTGVNGFRLSSTVMAEVLGLLKNAVTQNAVTTEQILPRLMTAFPSR